MLIIQKLEHFWTIFFRTKLHEYSLHARFDTINFRMVHKEDIPTTTSAKAPQQNWGDLFIKTTS